MNPILIKGRIFMRNSDMLNLRGMTTHWKLAKLMRRRIPTKTGLLKLRLPEFQIVGVEPGIGYGNP